MQSGAAIMGALIGTCTAKPQKPTDGSVPPVVLALCGDKTASQAFVEGPYAYVRGLAFHRHGQYREAADVFDAMISHRGANWGPQYPAAYVGLARSAARAGDIARAKQAYEAFFTLWKDADSDVPLLVAARKEYAALE
jgi:hypothetical protein